MQLAWLQFQLNWGVVFLKFVDRPVMFRWTGNKRHRYCTIRNCYFSKCIHFCRGFLDTIEIPRFAQLVHFLRDDFHLNLDQICHRILSEVALLRLPNYTLSCFFIGYVFGSWFMNAEGAFNTQGYSFLLCIMVERRIA